jgi:hypothetical protein
MRWLISHMTFLQREPTPHGAPGLVLLAITSLQVHLYPSHLSSSGLRRAYDAAVGADLPAT